MRERALRIHPAADIQTFPLFFLPDTPCDFLDGCDYIIDAIDTVSAKLALVEVAQRKEIPLSVAWARATNWTLPGLKWRTSMRLLYAPCAG